jgi:hypothetical protein
MSSLPQGLNAGRLRAWAVWLVPAVALALLIGWETDWGRQIVRVPAVPPAGAPKPIAAEVLPDFTIEGGLPAHAETVQRTLFNATRRPAPVLAADSGPRQIAHGRYQLMGTTVAGESKVAFLKDLGGGKTRAVREGEEIDGMKVAHVTPDRVTFTAGDDSEELFLKVAPGPKTTIAAAPPPPGAPAAAPAAAARGNAAARAAQAAAGLRPTDPGNDARAARRAARAAAAGGQNPGAAQGSDASGQGMQQQQQRTRRERR